MTTPSPSHDADEVLAHLRNDERRRFRLWLDTPSNDPLVHVRAHEWRASLKKLTEEQEHRARIAREAVRT